MGYRQLTQQQRYQIIGLREAHQSMREIARQVGCHNSAVSRELRRNRTDEGVYDPAQAQRASDRRRRSADKSDKRNPGVILWIRHLLREAWSPEQIAGFMKRIGKICVSHQWIYNLIHRDKAAGGTLWTHCRLPQSRRHKRSLAKEAGLGKIPDRTGIEEREADVEKRLTIGHWEGDTVLKGHKDSALVTLVERRSGYLKIGQLPKVTAAATANRIIKLLQPLRGAVLTITFDNGSEFAAHKKVEKALAASTYFCDPYKSCQRGTNENTNGLIRQYFPKGTDFATVSKAAIRKVERALNSRPRKRLGYRTPAEVFLGEYSGELKTSGAALNA